MKGILNKNQLTVVKEYDFNKPDIHEIDYLHDDDIIKDCRNKYFHTFEFRLVYDIQFTKISDNEELNFTIPHGSMEIKTDFYGLNNKNQNCSRKWFYIYFIYIFIYLIK